MEAVDLLSPVIRPAQALNLVNAVPFTDTVVMERRFVVQEIAILGHVCSYGLALNLAVLYFDR